MQINLSLDRPTAVTPSPRVLRVAGMFGLGVDQSRAITIVPPVALDLLPHQLVFITGMSGGGKSTLLRLIADAAAAQGARVIRFDALPALPDAPLVDCLARDQSRTHRQEWVGVEAMRDQHPARALELLSLAGLADAFVMLRRPCELSDGQRYRLRLAQAIELAETSDAPLTLVLADEFGATLDRQTAKVIAANLRKWTRRTKANICFIAATTHDDLLESLEPDVLVEMGVGEVNVATRDASGGRGSTRAGSSADGRCGPRRTKLARETQGHFDCSASSLTIEPARVEPRPPEEVLLLRPGTAADYAALAHHHYRASKPGTMMRILALEDRRPTVVGRYMQRKSVPRVAAVLVESLPSLSCRLRDEATGGRYAELGDMRRRARALNAEVRCISRVIVHPTWRGAGLAVRLVKAALDTATTPVTEAIAAMGNVHPFFEKAGMTAYRAARNESDARLLEALRYAGIEELQLALGDRCAAQIESLAPQRRVFIKRELKRWHDKTVLRRGASLREMLEAARMWLHCDAVYYLKVRQL